jgi:hypothetical protein
MLMAKSQRGLKCYCEPFSLPVIAGSCSDEAISKEGILGGEAKEPWPGANVSMVAGSYVVVAGFIPASGGRGQVPTLQSELQG